MDLTCGRCGNMWRIPLLPENASYKVEADYWRDRYYSLQSDINDMLKFTMLHYGMNPHKDQMLKMLEDLLDKFKDE